MSSVQIYLQQLWINMNQTFYKRTAQQLPSIFYYLISPLANLYFYYHYFDDFSDVKLREWPLMGSLIWPLTIVSIYLLIVYNGYNWLKNNENESSIGSVSSMQRWIQKSWSNQQQQQQQNSISNNKHHHHHYNHSTHSHHHHHSHHHYHNKSIQRNKQDITLAQRPLFGLLVFLYNVSMATLNAWIAYELLYCAWKSHYNFLCQLVYTGQDNPYENRIAIAIWWYFASKGIELIDTILIILKRKINQLTFLHIYHHSTMFLVWWVGAKFVPGGSAVTGALVNCLVHILMYTYYALASLGPKLQPYLWWKKYLTIIQLIQFTLGVTLGLNSIITGCPFTRWMQYVFVCYAFSFLVLFGNFYKKTYNKSLTSSFNQNTSNGIQNNPPQEVFENNKTNLSDNPVTTTTTTNTTTIINKSKKNLKKSQQRQ